MPELEGIVPTNKEIKIPEILPDQELGNLLAAVGNHEAKAITLGLMKPGILYTLMDLYHVVIEAQGPNPGWRINSFGPLAYCSESLEPIGLVAQEVATAGGFERVGYIKTEKGERLGEALAGHLLDFSLRYPDFALGDFLGQTASSSKSQEEVGIEYKKRAPLTRVKILRELLTRDLPIPDTDLKDVIDEKTNVLRFHLEELKRKNVVIYIYESVKQRPEVNLTSAQHSMILEFLTIIDNFQNQNLEFLAQGRSMLGEILASPEKVAALMRKAKEHSSHANRKYPEETQQELLYIINANPGITAKELQVRLLPPLGIHVVNRYLRVLKRTNQTRSEVIKGVPHYQIVDHKNPSRDL